MSSKYIESTNPAKNYEVIGKVEATSNEKISKMVDKANSEKDRWGKTSIKERVEVVKKLCKVFKDNEKQIAQLITKEIGTPNVECLDEVQWNWSYVDWFLDNVERSISPETTYEDTASTHQILYEPIGTAAVITPWNLPFDMFIWGVIPNLLVGNTVIYKAAEECILTGKLLETLAKKAELPEGILSFVHGGADEGKYLTEQDIDLIWFTGSSDVGRKIYNLAGKKFIKVILEMGGSNPAVVFQDANIDLAVDKIISKRFMFCGQTCDADKRVIIHKSKYEEFVHKFVMKVESLLVGDPQNTETQIGPLVSKKQLGLLNAQLNDAIKKGAKVLCGGTKVKYLKGAYFLPTVLTDITKNMRIWNEEVFGPILPIVKFDTEEEAIELANNTLYGLGSQVFTQDKQKALRIASQLKAGNVDINGAGHFKPFNPFGGYKNSGMGREHGIVGFRELCQIKTVSIER
jgi:acyl-CoA reductase-like NAD-dependent aldehyde dehydrogenase